MIRAVFDTPAVAAADGPAGARTIAGVAVPYGVPGRVVRRHSRRVRARVARRRRPPGRPARP